MSKKSFSVAGLFYVLAFSGLVWAEGGSSAGVHALFSLENATTGPFPSNWFTVGDQSQNTAVRVNLPFPDCKVYVSDCEDVAVLNELDGFNLQPRLSIPFDGPIDVHSVSSQTVFLVSLGDTLRQDDHGGQVVGMNQVVWDPDANTLHVESDELLDQHTRYALIVTTGLRGEDGAPVQASDAFRHFRREVRGGYSNALLDAIHAARRLGVPESDIVTASVFTTESATAILEKIRDQIHAATPAPADFLLGPGGTRTVFPLERVTGITFNRQIQVEGPPDSVPVDLAAIRVIPGAVGQIAFGKYLSPDYEVHPGEFIPAVGTRTGTPVAQGMNELFFNLFLPSGAKPAAGWPVAIFGHGYTNTKQGSPPLVAASMAHHGIATIAINVVGHGYGPFGTLTVNQTPGEPVTLSAGGRGFDQDGNGRIDATEGTDSTRPWTIIGNRDMQRQTAADLMQLVRVIQVGIDVDGDGVPDLDASRIYFVGQSVGAQYGTDFLAVEPDVRTGVLNVAGGWFFETGRLSPGGRALVGGPLAARHPSLLNAPGISRMGGVAVAAPHFNENMPLRNGIPLAVSLDDGTNPVIQSPVVNTVAGAMGIQEFFENREWVDQSGSPVAYAPHLRKNPLAGVPAKSVIIQFARGDQNVQNPATTALLRAGDLADRATFYRNDLAHAENPDVLTNPHGFMNRPTSTVRLMAEIALGAQRQIAVFFASDGKEIIHPEPARFFEVPVEPPLPEDLGFIP